MDVAIVHNFSEHPGGGDLVALDIVEALLERGYTVTLYTSKSEGLHRAAWYFSKDPEMFNDASIRKVSVPKAVRHPYNIYLIARKMLGELKRYNLTIFFDDIPKPAQELNKVLVYVHYPHAARILLNELVPYHYRGTLKGMILWKLHSTLFKQYFLISWSKPNIYAVTNSTLTYEHVAKALKPAHLAKIYPPVQVKQIMNIIQRTSENEESMAVYIGRIQPEKGIDDIVKAIALLENGRIKVRIMGFGHDNKYLEHLRRVTKGLKLEEHVEIRVNVARNEILESLAKARAIIHPAYHEPFGIAVVEGMAAGCMPIVRRGFNGPWIDITEQGKYGMGFENPEELAQALNSVLLANRPINVNDITERALMFNEELFRERFIAYIESILD